MIAFSDHIQIRKDGPCGTIVINRPDRRNALSREIVQMLSQAFDDFHSERSVRAIVLTGTGETFCSGTDLHQVQETGSSKDALAIWHKDATEMLELIEKILRFPKPVIASVNGWAVGTGVALVLASDIAIGGKQAQLLMPEPMRGLNSGVTVPLMSFRIGAGMTSSLLYSGLPVPADDALKLGLFHEVVEDDLIWARSFEVATACAQGARESHQMTKQLLNDTIGETLYTQLSIGAANMAAARTTDAAKEGISAFLEKRVPNWE